MSCRLLHWPSFFFSYIFNGQSTEVMDCVGVDLLLFSSCITHAALFTLVPFLILQVPLSAVGCRQWITRTILSIVYALLFIVAVVNSYVYGIYHFHINGLVLEMLTGPGASEIFVFSVWAYMKAIGLALSFVLLSIGLAFIAKFISKRLIIRHLNRNILLTLLWFRTSLARNTYLWRGNDAEFYH